MIKKQNKIHQRNENKRNEQKIVSLVNRYRHGDKEVFEEIFDYYCDRLYRFLYSFTSNSPYIEDIIQETFIRVAIHLDSLKDESRITEWIFSICRNTAINFGKKEKVYLKSSELNTNCGENISPIEDILKEERGKLVREALEKLTEDQRAVIILSRYEGLSYAEIATILNKTENAIKALVHRAMTRLGELLERNYNEL